MALVYESERSMENEYLADVIKDALSESDDGEDMPDANDDFWKPVMDPVLFNDKSSTLKPPIEDASNRDSAKSANTNISSMTMEQEIHIIRRSRSAELLPNTSLLPKEGEEYMTMSEMGSKEFNLKYEFGSRDSDSQPPFQHYVSDDEINADDDDTDEYGFENFREFEHRIDELELCDFALERTFLVLKAQIEEFYNQLLKDGGSTDLCSNEEEKSTKNKEENQPCRKKCQENQSYVVENITENLEQNDKKDPKQNDTTKGKNHEYLMTNDNINKEKSEGSKIDTEHEQGRFILIDTAAELKERFEQFVGHVGEMIQLGALSAKHAIRMESWAREVQSTYAALKLDQMKMQSYVESMEKDWSRRRHQLQYEISLQADQIAFLMEECCKRSDKNTRRKLHKRLGDKYLQVPSTPDGAMSDETIVDMLLQRRCADDQSMALDFARQSKISELKLLVLQQQNYIQRLELQNKEMQGLLKGVYFKDPEEEEPPQEYQLHHVNPLSEGLSQVADILYSDHTQYLPNRSTDPQVVNQQVFNIGGESSRNEPVVDHAFDPQTIGYVRTELQRTSGEVSDDPSIIAEDETGEYQADHGCQSNKENEISTQGDTAKEGEVLTHGDTSKAEVSQEHHKTSEQTDLSPQIGDSLGNHIPMSLFDKVLKISDANNNKQ